MPFLDHFGLQDYPFGLTPNPDLYFPLPEMESVLDALTFAVTRGDGLMKIVGEVGTGKTLLCRLLLARIGILPINIAYLNAPLFSEAGQIPALIAAEFKLKLSAKDDPLRKLRDFLIKEHAKGRRNVLVIDEAQALGALGIETVRLLSNLETDKDKLLQIVMFGQPELDRILSRKELRQVLQRVTFSFVTKPMSANSVAHYIDHRLDACARKAAKPATKTKTKKTSLPATHYVPRVRFTPAALAHVAKASRGLPRLVNSIADKALLAAFAQSALSVDRAHVRAACRETEGISWRMRWVGI